MKDAAALTSWLAALDGIGVDPDGAVTRLGYTDVEDAMHCAVAGMGESLGLSSQADSAGNTFVYNDCGEDEATLIASHCDSVVQGGKYDGVAGVLAGLLVQKWIAEAGLAIPLKVGIFRMEESSIFGQATVGSRLVTGKISEDALKKARNAEGESLYEIMRGRGWRTAPARISGVRQYLELHIEQGRVLESRGLEVGVLNSIAAPVRFRVTYTGRQDHSGATPMDLRLDALAGAAAFVLRLEALGRQEAKNATVATVGVLHNTPNAFNVVPGMVVMGIDIRGIDVESRQRVVDGALAEAEAISLERGLALTVEPVSASDPVALDPGVITGLSRAAEALNIPFTVMPSGAGHDAMNFADICPVGMLFIPCREGVSHNKDEYASVEAIVTGAKVLFQYLRQEAENQGGAHAGA